MALGASATAAPIQLYVDPAMGDDSSVGSRSQPLRSLRAAQHRLRQLRRGQHALAPAEVVLRAGVHYTEVRAATMLWNRDLTAVKRLCLAA